jgi:FkbM family methyltransferase
MASTASITRISGHKIRRLRERPDFRKSPVRALARRLFWRLRWMASERPWRLKLGPDLHLLTPKCGAGALIYYLGYSEPETAHFVRRFLKPGMVFWDVGAHIGEYSLMASRVVGPSGHVEAFEPQSDTFAYLTANIGTNHLTNVTPHESAVADTSQARRFTIAKEPSLSHLALGESIGVPVSTTTLDFVMSRSERTPHIVKVDVEGAEMLVLLGARDLLALPADEAPVWLMEYSPENCTRFGYSANDLLAVFLDYGYCCQWVTEGGALLPSEKAPPWRHSGNFVASKAPTQWGRA